MCGLAGVWRSAGSNMERLETSIQAMTQTLRHRGPDDHGIWADPQRGIAFGFRRLAIVDLSSNGHQPMHSRNGRFTLVFNGEVYNHRELAAELRRLGHTFRGHSDTEVILAAFEQWGVEAAVHRFVGMYAMAVWDVERRSLCLLRDRLGIKPLFVYQGGGAVAFASELKAIMALPEFSAEIDVDALGMYFRYMYVPAPHSIFRGVRKLLPGHLLEIRSPQHDLPSSRAYWSLEEIARRGIFNGLDGEDHELVDLLESSLIDAVKLRMRADVPLGAFLSGGVDSSTIVALMQETSPRPVRTFTIGFDVARHNEMSYAAAVARHLGTDHQDIHFSGVDALDLVPTLVDVFDEPLANPSSLPTYMLCHATRQEVTVALTGDGGDETFAGYNRYLYGKRAIGRASKLPIRSRQMAAAGLSYLRPDTWDRIHYGVAALFRLSGQRLVGEKIHKIAHLLRASTPPEMYRSLVSAWQEPPVAGGQHVQPHGMATLDDASIPLLERMMLTDQLGYLPDDLLAKVDRTSMAVGLEVRVPILDHRIVELSWRLPQRTKIRDGETKWALRQILERRVPRDLFDRPKVGFSVPLADWLRGPLRHWAEERLDTARLTQTPFLDVLRVREAWRQFLAGRSNQQLAIWTVVMFEAWRERWMT